MLWVNEMEEETRTGEPENRTRSSEAAGTATCALAAPGIENHGGDSYEQSDALDARFRNTDDVCCRPGILDRSHADLAMRNGR